MTAPHYEIITPETPDFADRQILVGMLMAFNDATGGPTGHAPFALLLKNPATGQTLGGLWGRFIYRWLYVETVIVPDSLRGQDVGTQLLTQAEHAARARDCIGIWLDTLNFQAEGFYTKLGYEKFGTLPGPDGKVHRIFMRKDLGGAGA